MLELISGIRRHPTFNSFYLEHIKTVSVNHMSLLDACVYQNDTIFVEPIQRSFCKDPINWFRAFDIAIRQNLPEFLELFIDYFKRPHPVYVQKALHQCIVSSIIYSHCSILRKILDIISNKEYQCPNMISASLVCY